MSVRVGNAQGMKHAAIVLATSAFLTTGQAHAQTGDPNRVSYTAADFAQYAPANALDMIQRTPGFIIIEADADLRGYAGARGNVLIDGASPTSKHEDVDDLLSRIPAASVERIELIRGGAGVDMSGYAVLANIVRRQDAATEGAVEGGGTVSMDGWSAPSGKAEYALRSDRGSLGLVVKLDSEIDDDSGTGVVRTSRPSAGLAEVRLLDVRATKTAADIGADWQQTIAGGELTGKAALRGERTQTDTLISRAIPDRDAVNEDEDFLEADVSARYERLLDERWNLVVLASQRLGWLDALEKSDENGETERFAERTDSGESIARIDLAYDLVDDLKLSVGMEGAFNFLESRARLEEDGTPVVLPGSDVRIEEQRVEASFEVAWRLWKGWVLEAGLRFEDSVIAQTGDTQLRRDFDYAKPRVSADWAIDAFNDLRLAYTREVGQLDFSDFVASASLDTGTVSAGNAGLEPAKTSRWTAAWEHRFSDGAAVAMTWAHESIVDVVDRVLVTTPDDQFDAPGNIGEGEAQTFKLEFATPLDGVGVPGGQFRSSALWRSSSVTDPVTGELRGISEDKPVEAFVSLTQDLRGLRLNWGVEVDHIAERETRYRYDEVIRSSEDASWTLFAEWRFEDRWTLRAEATDLLGRDFSEQRTRYDGVRSNSPIDEWQGRDRRTPGYVTITLRHRMGD